MLAFTMLYIYAIIKVFYVLYIDDFSDVQLDIDTKLNYTYNNSYIVSNVIQNAIIQNM